MAYCFDGFAIRRIKRFDLSKQGICNPPYRKQFISFYLPKTCTIQKIAVSLRLKKGIGEMIMANNEYRKLPVRVCHKPYPIRPGLGAFGLSARPRLPLSRLMTQPPGTGVRRGQRERAWVKFQKGQKVKRSHLTKVKKWKWKGEYRTRWMMNEVNGVNEVNGEFGESAQFANAIFQRTEMRRFLNII